MNSADIREIFRRLAELRPDPKSELNYRTPFELLVAVVLSAQATDKSVNEATKVLYAHANTPEAILALGEEGLIPYINRIGLYRNKAKHVIGLCSELIKRFNGEVPEDFDALCSLPGVGHKTANVVLNVAFGHPTVAVDTHIFRVANRTGIAPGKTPDEVSEAIVRVCPIRDLCEFDEKTPAPEEKPIPHILPKKEGRKPRAASASRKKKSS